MKTIEERAKEYASKKADISLSAVYNEALASIYEEAYVAGAKEQQAIDDAELLRLKSSWEREAQINHNDEANYQQGYHDAVEKACEWIDKYLHLFVMKGNILYPKLAQEFRKSMEE